MSTAAFQNLVVLQCLSNFLTRCRMPAATSATSEVGLGKRSCPESATLGETEYQDNLCPQRKLKVTLLGETHWFLRSKEAQNQMFFFTRSLSRKTARKDKRHKRALPRSNVGKLRENNPLRQCLAPEKCVDTIRVGAQVP